jgi:hypothetical protein
MVATTPSPLPVKTVHSFNQLSELAGVTLGAAIRSSDDAEVRLYLSTFDTSPTAVAGETLADAVLRAAKLAGANDFNAPVLTGVMQAADGAYHVGFLAGKPESWTALSANANTYATAAQVSSVLKAVVTEGSWFNLSSEHVEVKLPPTAAIGPIGFR